MPSITRVCALTSLVFAATSLASPVPPPGTYIAAPVDANADVAPTVSGASAAKRQDDALLGTVLGLLELKKRQDTQDPDALASAILGLVGSVINLGDAPVARDEVPAPSLPLPGPLADLSTIVDALGLKKRQDIEDPTAIVSSITDLATSIISLQGDAPSAREEEPTPPFSFPFPIPSLPVPLPLPSFLPPIPLKRQDALEDLQDELNSTLSDVDGLLISDDETPLKRQEQDVVPVNPDAVSNLGALLEGIFKREETEFSAEEARKKGLLGGLLIPGLLKKRQATPPAPPFPIFSGYPGINTLEGDSVDPSLEVGLDKRQGQEDPEGIVGELVGILASVAPNDKREGESTEISSSTQKTDLLGGLLSSLLGRSSSKKPNPRPTPTSIPAPAAPLPTELSSIVDGPKKRQSIPAPSIPPVPLFSGSPTSGTLDDVLNLLASLNLQERQETPGGLVGELTDSAIGDIVSLTVDDLRRR